MREVVADGDGGGGYEAVMKPSRGYLKFTFACVAPGSSALFFLFLVHFPCCASAAGFAMAQWLGHCESHSKLRPKITAGFAAARKVRAHTPRFVPYHRGDFPISQWAMQLGVVMGAIRPPGNPPLLLLVGPGSSSLDPFVFSQPSCIRRAPRSVGSAYIRPGIRITAA